ncbi:MULTISPECIES: NADPH-dependent FMN reductase [unclassified Rhodococcus (in: high G+C Gram-positive bacteria)]|uniref:NADPH-dependent FMN reductase n=1 Tax=unclassified Rhodococcus (in: high G+C Gram-positive bacteria) TaxID=192944 RepID=UPI00163A2927|nr:MULTISPECIES: NAD(P)H-dependent oxidoreductase [unclassified Rhodococcus (in: high G+C Gram-positive bacteria)]MBC2643379.1 NAD(P)H-dependent oxidoreductase [Rhodococcus sp. 3A]MBC2891881.1 NAD(P)H-dependent oxidoreductase [Rhodococcus sp. 4CII]
MTAAEPVRIEIVVGSVRVGRIAPVVTRWFAERARAHPGLDVGIIDLADTPLPQDLGASPATEEFRERVGRADAFVIVTSEYNHGYPAALKTAFDSVKHEWRTKPIGFVSYGGLSGGLRATEQLRQVVAELHMVSVRQSVSFHQVRKRFDDAGQTSDGAAADSADRMLAELVWWADATRGQRARIPYPG